MNLRYKGNVPLKRDEEKYVIGDDGSGLCILRVKSTVKQDADTYTCKLINSAGSAHSSCSVTILGRKLCYVSFIIFILHSSKGIWKN